nr:hypothetical protein [Tanacetum cinerariifolium]
MTHHYRQQTEMASKIASQDLEIASLMAKIKMLEDKDGGGDDPSGEDATIKGRCLETGRKQVATVSIPPAGEIPTVSVPTGSGVVASLVFTTATVATPYSRRKGKEKMVESETPKKKKLQEQMDVQMARQLEEDMARDAQRMNKQRNFHVGGKGLPIEEGYCNCDDKKQASSGKLLSNGK